MAEENKANDKELDDLLDSALEDFKEVSGDKKKAEGSASGSKESSGNDGAAGVSADDADAFFMEQAKLVADRMSTLFGGGPDTPSGDVPPLPQDPDQILAGFKKMAEAAALTLQGDNPAKDEDVAKYSDSIAQALKGLQEGANNLASPVSDNDIANMFGSLNLGNDGGEGSDNMFLPFMEGMMQSLLSAEILMPSIKELLEKYPKYLEEKGDEIPVEDKERYVKQMELYKVIEGLLEKEDPNDSAQVKRDKFKNVLEHMKKLQEYGQPPEEILAETAGDLPMLDSSALSPEGSGPQCPTM